MQILQENENDAFSNFLNGIRAEKTKINYTNALKRFLKFHNIKDCNYLLSIEKVGFERLIRDHLIDMKNRRSSYGHVVSHLTALCTFAMLNDIEINRRKLNRYLPEQMRKIKDRGYSREEIQKLLQNCDQRFQTIIYILASTGMRIGAVINLKLKHIQKIENYQIYKFTIYENAKEEYITFCTPECSNAIDIYLEYRERVGEEINKESPLIREQFNINDPQQSINRPRFIQLTSFYCMLRNIARKAGLRQVEHGNGTGTRKQVQLNHGFRKFFNTVLIDSNVNYTVKEMLMGHKYSIGLDHNYYRPTETKMIEEYIKAVNPLTINEENRLKNKLTKYQEQEKEIANILAKMELMEKKMGFS